MTWRPWKPKTSDEFEALGAAGLIGDEITDTVADILEIFGQRGFDTTGRTRAELERLCQQWARHVRDGEPIPGSDLSSESEAGPAWKGVTRFLAIQRDQEQAHVLNMGSQYNAVTESLEELKCTLRDFAQGLRYAVTEDETADAEVVKHLEILNDTAQSVSNIALLREKVTQTVHFVNAAIEARHDRHSKQVEELGRELVALKAELATASSEAERDGLTELYNRKALDAQLDRTVALCQMTGRPTCVVMVDLDNFKAINDDYGHQAGDKTLQELGRVLNSVVLRKSDFVARYGGDEFTIILNNCRLSAARFITDRLLNTVRNIEVASDAGTFGITVSMGIAELGARETRDEWLKRADLNLLSAKRAGRDRVH